MSLDLTSQPTSDTRDGLGPLHSNEIIIGLALGSPRENTHPALPDEYHDHQPSPSPPSRAGLKNDYSDSASQSSQSSPPRQSARTYVPNSGLKRSGSKWKNLGSLFSKKGPSAPPFDGQPFYMLDRPSQRDGPQPAQEPAVFERPSAQDPLRRAVSPLEPQAQTTCSAEPPRQSGAKAMLRRASTRRLGIRKRARAQTGGSLESNRGSPARIRLEERRQSEEPIDASTWVTPNGHGNQRTPAGAAWLSRQQRLLEVEIPSVELERYSVMFGDVLKTKPGKPGMRSSRRQSQLRELKPSVTEKENDPSGPTLSPLSSNPPLAAKPPRPEHSRMDSSSSSGSKSSTGSTKYGLFPPPGPLQKRNTAHKPPPKPSPLSRSVTAPNANAHSFQRPAVSTTKSQGPDELRIEIQEAEAPPAPAPISTKSSSTHHRRTSSFNPSDLSSSAIPHDDLEYEEEFEEEHESYIRPSTANDATEAPTFSRSAFPVRKSSMRVPQNSPAITPRIPPSETFPTLSPSVPANPPPLTTDGEVSVARQVSISRRQRTVVPIVPQGAKQQQPMRAKLIEDTRSNPSFPVRKDSHQSYEVTVES